MAYFLGLDTSNYTTSAALYDDQSKEIIQTKKLLPVKDGALGLRQSDAVFSHVKQMGGLLEELFGVAGTPVLSGIGVSVRPREQDGSYMPCFLVGELVAQSVATVGKLPVTHTSHQHGHIMAALYSAKKLDLIGTSFIAFHLSGGTTECLLVEPERQQVFCVNLIAQSLDLKAGQAIDRVGGLLGLPFPAGRLLDSLAAQSKQRYKIRPSFKKMDCSLSGVENKCKKMQENGEASCDIARYCIDFILAIVDQMTQNVLDRYGKIPIIYAGGVMSNAIIQDAITQKYGGFFAEPAFSSDNAAGVALLAAYVQSGGYTV